MNEAWRKFYERKQAGANDATNKASSSPVKKGDNERSKRRKYRKRSWKKKSRKKRKSKRRSKAKK